MAIAYKPSIVVAEAPFSRHSFSRGRPSSAFLDKSMPRTRINALFNPQDDPIVKEALKEPLAFLGGVFAGILRLDLNEDPLKEWISKTSEAAGIKDYEEKAEDNEETPEEIQIE